MDITGLYYQFSRHLEDGVTTDSREVKKGQIFFALRGDRFDGNRFASEAVQAGASFVVVDDPSVVVDERYLLVKDTLVALQELALFHRKKFDIPVIGITGSNGKTTTKELISRILSVKYKVNFTHGNLNNHIGVPLTILDMDQDTEMAIIEMGANHRGEIARLCEIANPDFGLITNIGKAHLEGFGSCEGVKTAKGELYEHLSRLGGVVFCNQENDELMQMLEGFKGEVLYYGPPASLCHGKMITEDPRLKMRLTFSGDNAVDVETDLSGAYNLENILAAAAVGLHFRISAGDIKQAIETHRTTNRSQRIETSDNTLILDAYNANPTSMHAALDAFNLLSHAGKVLILGEMYELGNFSQKEHQELVERLLREKYHEVYLVGQVFGGLNVPEEFTVFGDTEDMVTWLKDHPLKGRMILLKGSRVLGLDRLSGSL